MPRLANNGLPASHLPTPRARFDRVGFVHTAGKVCWELIRTVNNPRPRNGPGVSKPFIGDCFRPCIFLANAGTKVAARFYTATGTMPTLIQMRGPT